MNVKVNIKRPQITKEEIAANKNFGDVLKQYKAFHTPFYRRSSFYAALSAAAAVVVAIIIYIIPATDKKTLSYIHPPLKKMNISPAQYSMNAESGTVITCRRGSVIKIPAKAFVDKSGKTVQGKVNVTYRELCEPVDFFISGLPAGYDSAGVQYAFESAGMIEIHASQEGKELDLDPEKVMDIMVASHEPNKQFNLYQLDNEKKQWVYRGKEELSSSNEVADRENNTQHADAQAGGSDSNSASTNNPQLADIDSKLESARYELQKSEATLKQMELSKPFEPKEESKGHHRFTVNVSNLKDFPEFGIYKDVLFQANNENENFDNKAYNIAWDDATLGKKGGSYVLNLRSRDTEASYTVHPVFEGEGYIAAQKIYKQKLDEYESALLERRAAEGEKQQEMEAMVEAINESRQAAAAHIANPENLTYHNITVHGCGIWNLANPVQFPQGAQLSAHFTDEKGKEIQFAAGKIYLVEKGRNALFSFRDNGVISYNPEKQNMIWGVTSDNKIAVFRYDDFKAAGRQSGDYTFKMQVSNVDLADEEQVQYFLNI